MSEFTIDAAMQFSEAVKDVATVIQSGLEALDRLMRAVVEMFDFMSIRRVIDRFLVQAWAERRPLSVVPPHTRHAMRARKMRQYHQAIIA